MAFAYQAVDSGGKQVTGVLQALTIEEATDQLHARHLFVTQVTEAKTGSAAKAQAPRAPLLAGRPGNTRDLLLLSQQMTMMLQAGSRVVPALEAIEYQLNKPQWRAILADVRQQVETGSSLSAALTKYPEIFDEAWRAIISAGESTGQTAEAFARLALMTKQQQQIRVRVIGTMVYPLVLMAISVVVLCVLMFFVLPRFDDLYTMLNTPLPGITKVLLSISRWMKGHLLLVAVGAVGLILAPIALWRRPEVRMRFNGMIIHLPMLGKLARQIILARIFRVWGTAVRSSVPLLESLKLSRDVTHSPVYRGLMDKVIIAVSEGNSIGNSLAEPTAAGLIPRTMSSAISTGEQSGQLGEALLFLAGYMEEENAQALATVTRLIEPVILVLMGATVGVVAISLFLPLFDLTSATGGRH